MNNTKEELKLSEYVKVFILLAVTFKDVDKACKWLEDYGAMYKDEGFIVNWAGMKVTSQHLLDRIKIFFDLDKEEWNE
jgi:hypothetical protein